MKRILKNLVLFSIPVFLIIIGLFVVLKVKINKSNLYLIPPNKTILFLGHSQTECALNDTLIANSINLSQGGEAYFYTYLKLKKLTSENRQIKTVILSYSNNQIIKKMDDWVWGEKSIKNFYPKYSALMGYDEYKLLMNKNFVLWTEAQRISIKENILFFFKGYSSVFHDGNWGGFLFLKRNKLEENRLLKFNPNESKKLSEINIEYLKKIALYCEKEEIKLYFIRTPIYSEDNNLENEKIFIGIKNNFFKKIKFLDFKDFPIKNNEFGDFVHINNLGAKKISIFLNQEIKKGLLECDNPQFIIDSEIKRIKQ